MKTCKIVAKHQKQNHGATNLIWLENHIKTCPTCQQLMGQANQIVKEAFDALKNGKVE